MSNPQSALALEGLTKKFGNFVAVDQLSLEVSPGQMVGFLGPNGAGKSTTLYMIPRLVRPTSGRIRMFGTDIWQDYKTAMRSVGVMKSSWLGSFCSTGIFGRVVSDTPRTSMGRSRAALTSNLSSITGAGGFT